MSEIINNTEDLTKILRDCGTVESLALRQNEIVAFFAAKFTMSKELSAAIFQGIYAQVLKTPALLGANAKSFVSAAAQAAIMGLALSPEANECYFVPYNKIITLVPTARGMLKLAIKAGIILSVSAYVIYYNEPLTYNIVNGDTEFRTTPNPDRKANWEKIRCVIVTINSKCSNKPIVKMVTKSQLDIRRAKSPAYRYASQNGKENPYITYPDDMAATKAIKSALALYSSTSSNINPATIDEYSYDITDNGIIANSIPIPSYETDLDNKVQFVIQQMLQIPENPAWVVKNGAGGWIDKDKRAFLAAELKNLMGKDEAFYKLLLAEGQHAISAIQANWESWPAQREATQNENPQIDLNEPNPTV